MKYRTKNALRILTILIIVSSALVFLLLTLLDDIEWQFIDSAPSPNGEFEIYQFRNNSDRDRHAPYGEYLYLSQAHNFKRARNGYLLFAGYCKRDTQYHWANDKTIVINCSTNDSSNHIKTIARRAFGINIELKND